MSTDCCTTRWKDEGLVEEVEGLENQRAELVVELVIKVVKEVTE
ncbi:hypothetical protein Tco_0229655, partial [Tanacetum coccineum]